MGLKNLFAGAIFSFLIIGCKEAEKKEAVKVEIITKSIHSDIFNTQFDTLLNTYFSLSEALVNWDTAKINTESIAFQSSIAQLNFDEIKSQDSMYKAAEANKTSLAAKGEALKTVRELEAKRRAFQQISETLKHLIETVKYDVGDIYLMKCPMAFNDDETAYWLSKKDEIRNPYLGTKHPKYKATMLSCGSSEGRIDAKKQSD